MFSFTCTRCGACCNSAPALSLPELFHHQERFIGCLSLRRVDSLQPRTSQSGRAPISAAECSEFDEWVPQFLHRAQGLQGTVFISLNAQAYDEPSLERCPALTTDKECALEQNNKPLGCRAVPLDPILPDTLQQHLLQQRAKEAVYMGANCITVGALPSDALLVAGAKVTAPDAHRTLLERRAALILDKHYWGNAVFEMMRAELFAHPARVSALPNHDYYPLSLTPVLSALCAVSSRVRTRVLEFLTVQIELLAAALHSVPPKSAPVETTLLGFFRANLALRGALQRNRDDDHETPDAYRVEEWLGLGRD